MKKLRFVGPRVCHIRGTAVKKGAIHEFSDEQADSLLLHGGWQLVVETEATPEPQPKPEVAKKESKDEPDISEDKDLPTSISWDEL